MDSVFEQNKVKEVRLDGKNVYFEQHNDSILLQIPKREQSLSSLFASHVIDTRNVRQQFCDEATEIINRERIGTKWKPVTKRAVAIRINFVCPKGHDNFVHDFRKQCQQAKNYSKCFWGASKKSL